MATEYITITEAARRCREIQKVTPNSRFMNAAAHKMVYQRMTDDERATNPNRLEKTVVWYAKVSADEAKARPELKGLWYLHMENDRHVPVVKGGK